jgi:hypothetical protein
LYDLGSIDLDSKRLFAKNQAPGGAADELRKRYGDQARSQKRP